jgi:cell division protein ZapB
VNSVSKAVEVDGAILRLEQLIRLLGERCTSLHEENQLLQEQLRQLRADRAVIKERSEQARHRVEGMVARLKTIEPVGTPEHQG